MCSILAKRLMYSCSGKQGWYWWRKSHCECQVMFGALSLNAFFLLGRWVHNHTELDCSDECLTENIYYGSLKISVFCCKGEDFCNRYVGQVVNKDFH